MSGSLSRRQESRRRACICSFTEKRALSVANPNWTLCFNSEHEVSDQGCLPQNTKEKVVDEGNNDINGDVTHNN